MENREIVELMNKTGLSDDQLARELNVSTPTIRRWKSGKSYPATPMWSHFRDKLKKILEEE